MAALTGETSRKTRLEDRAIKGSKAVKTGVIIYKGALLAIEESTGRLTNAAAAPGLSDVVGVALETATGNAAGTVSAEFQFGHIERIATRTALTKAYISCEAFVADNDMVSRSSIATANARVAVGKIVEFDGDGGNGGACWVWIGVHARKTAP